QRQQRDRGPAVDWRGKREELCREHTFEAGRQGPGSRGHNRVKAGNYRAIGSSERRSSRPSFGRFRDSCEYPKLQAEKGVSLQRSFSTLPNGWPVSGLLTQRLTTAIFLFFYVFTRPIETPQTTILTIPHLIGLGAAIFLLVGLWTPSCRTLIAVV